MLIATFGPTTAWVGMQITREGDAFVLEGHGPISAGDIMEYDRKATLCGLTPGPSVGGVEGQGFTRVERRCCVGGSDSELKRRTTTHDGRGQPALVAHTHVLEARSVAGHRRARRRQRGAHTHHLGRQSRGVHDVAGGQVPITRTHSAGRVASLHGSHDETP